MKNKFFSHPAVRILYRTAAGAVVGLVTGLVAYGFGPEKIGAMAYVPYDLWIAAGATSFGSVGVISETAFSILCPKITGKVCGVTSTEGLGKDGKSWITVSTDDNVLNLLYDKNAKNKTRPEEISTLVKDKMTITAKVLEDSGIERTIYQILDLK